MQFLQGGGHVSWTEWRELSGDAQLALSQAGQVLLCVTATRVAEELARLLQPPAPDPVEVALGQAATAAARRS